MDLLDLMKLTFRRWYITAPVLALSIAAAVGVGVAIRPEYRSTVAIVLVPPTGAAPASEPDAAPAPGNPWPRIGVGAMAQAVQIAASAHDARGRVLATGGDPDYQVELIPRSSILTIEVAAGSPGTALTTVKAVTDLIHDEVARRQAPYQAAPGDQITAQVLDPGRHVAASRSNVLRMQIVVVGIGVLLAAAFAVAYDAAVRHLAARGQRAGSGSGRSGDGPGRADDDPGWPGAGPGGPGRDGPGRLSGAGDLSGGRPLTGPRSATGPGR